LNLGTIVNAQEDCWFIIPLFPAGLMFFCFSFSRNKSCTFWSCWRWEWVSFRF
jgi:hypothetical protein